MCGIAGLIEWADPRATRSRAEAMLAALAHRGPDDQGLYVAPPAPRASRPSADLRSAPAPQIVLGHRRLAVVDRGESGHQPMPGADGLVWAVHDGRIHNHAELREELRRLGFRFRGTGDTEVLLNAYLAWGTDCVERFNGMFAFAVYDARDRSLFLARDRFGVKPLFWYADAGRLLFASEIGALLTHPDVPRRMDPVAAYRFLAMRISDCDDRTFFADIRSLPGGSRMRLRGLGEPAPPVPAPEIHVWYRPNVDRRADELSEDKRTELFATALEDAVRVRLAADVPVGGLLCGGPGSAALAAMLLRSRGPDAPPPKVFHPAGTGLRRAAELFGPQMVQVPTGGPSAADFERLVSQQQEPFAPSTELWNQPAFAAASAGGVGVVLLGLGARTSLGFAEDIGRAAADHLSAGRWRSWWIETQAALQRRGGLAQLVAGAAPRPWRQAWADRNRPPWLCFDFARALRGGARPGHRLQPAPPKPPAAGATPAAPDSAAADALRLDRPAGRLTDECLWRLGVAPIPAELRQLDRIASAHSLETRLPFLDYRIVELSAGLPVEDRISAGQDLIILRRAFGAVVAPDVFDQPRDGPQPFADDALRTLAPMLDDLFASRDLGDAGVFEPRRLRMAWQLVRQGRGPAGADPFAWASFLLWRRRSAVTAKPHGA